jgi:hypothetical protein
MLSDAFGWDVSGKNFPPTKMISVSSALGSAADHGEDGDGDLVTSISKSQLICRKTRNIGTLILL